MCKIYRCNIYNNSRIKCKRGKKGIKEQCFYISLN